MYITYTNHSFFFVLRNEGRGLKFEGLDRGVGEGLDMPGRDGGVGWGGVDTGFSKILPEAKSIFIQMYNCFVFKFLSPKIRGEEKCAKVPRSHWKRQD